MNKMTHNRFTRRVIVTATVFVLCAMFMPCAFAAVAEAPPAKNPERFQAAIEGFEKNDQQNTVPEVPILFVGSSSVRMWLTAESFPELPVINRGFGGSTIADANHYFDRVVAKYKPAVIVFYSGDNDISGGKSPEQVFDDFELFMQKVRTQLPGTKVLVLSIKPSIARAKLWPKMKEVNSLIAKLAKEDPQLEYVDIATPMLAKGSPPPADLFLKDGLHLNQAGYELWNKALEPSLTKAYESRAVSASQP